LFLIIAVILVVLWLIGIVSSYTLGGWIHLFLVPAILIAIQRANRGRGR